MSTALRVAPLIFVARRLPSQAPRIAAPVNGAKNVIFAWSTCGIAGLLKVVLA